MAGILWTGFMGRTATTLGWQTNTVRFAEREVAATVALSSYLGQNGDRFAPFQQRYARCWIETERTPVIVVAGTTIPMADPFADVQVRMTTSWLTFQLQTDGVGGGAVETVYDIAATSGMPAVVDRTDRVVHDERGRMVATHREVQLEGGAALDPGAIDEVLLARAAALELEGLHVAPVDLDAFPGGAMLAVDVESGRVSLQDRQD